MLKDEYFRSPSFINVGLNTSYKFNLDTLNTSLELTGGVKNIFDDYQSSFDVGKERDSNFIYGPATPRTFVIGVKLISNEHYHNNTKFY